MEIEYHEHIARRRIGKKKNLSHFTIVVCILKFVIVLQSHSKLHKEEKICILYTQRSKSLTNNGKNNNIVHRQKSDAIYGHKMIV